MSPELVGVIGLCAMLILMFLGVHIAITLALVGLYMFLYIPEARRLVRLRGDHSALKEELAAARQKISLRPNIGKDIERAKKAIAEIEATISHLLALEQLPNIRRGQMIVTMKRPPSSQPGR